MTQTDIVTDLDSDPFWQAAETGRLLIQRSPSTGAPRWYPRVHLPGEQPVEPEWIEASGAGTIFSFTMMHRGPAPEAVRFDPPVILALVELTEGPLMLMRCLPGPSGRVAVGMGGDIRFEPDPNGRLLPTFRTAD